MDGEAVRSSDDNLGDLQNVDEAGWRYERGERGNGQLGRTATGTTARESFCAWSGLDVNGLCVCTGVLVVGRAGRDGGRSSSLLVTARAIVFKGGYRLSFLLHSTRLRARIGPRWGVAGYDDK